MENFEFECKTKVFFGKNCTDKLGVEVKKHSNKVLLCCGEGSIKRNGIFDLVVNQLKDNGVEYIEFGGAQPNPRLRLVEEGVSICRSENIKFILALGGGSVIDTAKGIALGVPYSGNVWDFYANKEQPKEALPVGVILTIPAAGSETSQFSVLTNEETCEKIGYGTNLIRPVFAFMDPTITYTLPSYQTACGCVDIMMHTLERYFTNVKEVALTDNLCEGLLKLMVDYSVRVINEPDNYNLRANIMWAGSISHNDLMGTGRIGDFASHSIEHELGAIYDIAHGAGLAVVFLGWARHVYKHNLNRFTQFAVRVMNIDMDFENPEITAIKGIDRLEELFTAIGMPTRLSQMGIGNEKWEEMANKCTQNNTVKVGNFLPLDRDDIVKVLELCM